jgi:hypothetical protein
MIAVRVFTDEELLENLAEKVGNPKELERARIKVHSRILELRAVSEADAKLISRFIELVNTMKETDMDLRGKSQRMENLEAEFVEVRNQLLSRMNEALEQPRA